MVLNVLMAQFHLDLIHSTSYVISFPLALRGSPVHVAVQLLSSFKVTGFSTPSFSKRTLLPFSSTTNNVTAIESGLIPSWSSLSTQFFVTLTCVSNGLCLFGVNDDLHE